MPSDLEVLTIGNATGAFLMTNQSQLSDNEVTIRELKRLLRSIISDAQEMQPHCNPDNHWFGPFSEYEENDPDDDSGLFSANIEWPNLAISVGEAEAYLKELEAK